MPHIRIVCIGLPLATHGDHIPWKNFEQVSSRFIFCPIDLEMKIIEERTIFDITTKCVDP